MNRPAVNVRPWEWRDQAGNATPGIALWHPKKSLVAHMTYGEARTLADRLHDLADAAGNPEPALPTTEAEQE